MTTNQQVGTYLLWGSNFLELLEEETRGVREQRSDNYLLRAIVFAFCMADLDFACCSASQQAERPGKGFAAIYHLGGKFALCWLPGRVSSPRSLLEIEGGAFARIVWRRRRRKELAQNQRSKVEN